MAKEPKKRPLMGPVRQNLEAFGVAILAAVLLKWFCIEAFQIPTSSMQPTLMGSVETGVHDRIIVDKILPTFREPKRWDITVFKYPLQKNQNYVKRIGGMPGDRLRIAGGNLYQVTDKDGQRTYETIRKPDDLQAGMWKNVYPGRRLARSETKGLGATIGASPSSAASEDETGITLSMTGNSVRLFFRDETDGGMLDRVWDGYPEEVARVMREKAQLDQPQEIVPDARLSATLLPEQAMAELSLEIQVLRPEADWTFALAVRDGKGELQVRGSGVQVLGKSAQFPFDLPAGSSTTVAFAHVDDQLIAWHNGSEVARFDSSAWACRDGCVLPLKLGRLPMKGNQLDLPSNQKVIPQIAVKGKGKLRIDDLRIDRDQHYTQSTAPDVIEVPDGHYYMLGDNTLQSIDSRGWTAIEIGVDADNNVVPPETPNARTVRGNKRAMPLINAPDRDETPIAFPNEKKLVMIDEFGELLSLNAEIGPDWPRIAFRKPGSQDGSGEWAARELPIGNTKGISFVPRSDIQGRAVLVFYPSRPLSWLMGSKWPDRFGFVR